MLVLVITTLAAVSAASTYTVPVDQNGQKFEARYSARVEISTRQIGISPPNRPSTARCLWTSTAHVQREMLDQTAVPIAALSRVVDKSILAKGSRNGTCIETRKAIFAEARLAQGKVEEHVVAIAKQDAPSLSGDLASLRNLRAGQTD